MNQSDDYTKDGMTLERRLDLIESIDFSHSVFCLHLSPDYMAKMNDLQFDQLMKLIQIYRQDVNLLMGLSNTP